MKITIELLHTLSWGEFQPDLFGDMEDVAYNIKTEELFHYSCVDGSLELYRKVKDWEDLQQALYAGFKIDSL